MRRIDVLGGGLLALELVVGFAVGSAVSVPSPLVTTPTPTPAPTAGVASERGLASFIVLLVLIGGTLWYLRRRRA